MNNYPRLTIKPAALCAIVFCSAATQGCITTKTYLDPQFHRANYSDIQRVNPPYSISVDVIFEINGVRKSSLEASVRDHVERSLRTTGVVVPYDGRGPSAGALIVTVNDIGNIGAAAAKGFVTGLTFGLAGSHVIDTFEISCRLTQPDAVTTKTYQDTIHTTIGLHSGPAGLTRVAAGDAINQMVDEVALIFLKDMQADGHLVSPRSPQ